MSDLLTHIARLEMVDVDMDLEPQCESLWHDDADQRVFHSDSPATHFQITPCGHGNGLRCAGWVATARRSGGHCDLCGREAEPGEYRFIEL